MLLNLSLGELLAIFGAISAVTVALYLLDRNRRKQVVSTLRFWVTPGLPSPVTRRRKIQQPLSLLLQLLGMLLLLSAIAEIHWGGTGRARRDHVLIVDTSAWMRASAPGRPNATLMDLARANAISWLRAVPDSDRVLLVRADALATPATSWETDHVKVARAILETKPGATTIDLGQSLEFARQLQKQSRSSGGEIVYDGPGRIAASEAEAAPVSVPMLRYLQVADPSENVGLRSVGARRSGTTPDTWDILVRLKNYGKTARKVNVTLNLGHAPMGNNPATLAPDAEQDTAFVIHTKAAGLAEVRIYPDDVFAADNYASLELPAQRSLHVVVYSNSPEEWRPALESDPRIAAEFRNPRDFKQADNDGLVILDRFHPSAPPAGNTLWIDPPEKSPIAIREHVTEPSGLQWAPDQPLAAGLREHDLRVPATAILEAGTSDIKVAEVDKGPVIAARESADGKTRTIVMGFSPFAGSLRYELAAPLLLANELRWFVPDVFRDVDVTARSAGSVSDAFVAPRNGDVRVITDAGTNLPFNIRDGKIRFFTGAAARVSVISDDTERVYSLTLPEMWDERWVPPAGVRRGIPAWNDSIRRSTDLWPWLAALGAAVLLLEYLLYGREMSALLRVIRAHMERPGQSFTGGRAA